MGQFRFLTGGESHGKGLVAIVEGMVADLPLQEEYINAQLKRRQQGHGRGPRMKIEEDKAEIMAGVRYGLTTGSPIALFITNRDWQNWQEQFSISPLEKEVEPVTCPRPGHADLAGVTKYGLKDIRPIIERASARETAARVAVGAIARRFLEDFGMGTTDWGGFYLLPIYRARFALFPVMSPNRQGVAMNSNAQLLQEPSGYSSDSYSGGCFPGTGSFHNRPDVFEPIFSYSCQVGMSRAGAGYRLDFFLYRRNA